MTSTNTETSDFLEIYFQKCNDYSIKTPIPRLIKEYKELQNKEKIMKHLILNGNCVSMFEQRLHNIDVFPICDTLEIYSSVIVSLDLSCNAIGDSGANSLARMIRINQTLKLLKLSSNSITEKGAADLADALKENKSLCTLDISLNSIGDIGGIHFAEMLKENSGLRILNLSSCDLKTSAITLLAVVMKENKTLIELNLAKPLLHSRKEETIVHISEMFKSNSTLRVLDISYHRLADSGISILLKNLTVSKCITDLNLSGNAITISANLIARYFEHPYCALKRINLSANRIDSEGGIEISESLKKNRTITSIDLAFNNLDDESLVAISDCLLSWNHTVRELKIMDNKFDQSSIQSFDKLIRERNTPLILDITTYKTDNTWYWTKKVEPIFYEYGVDTKKEQIEEIEKTIMKCSVDEGVINNLFFSK
ncbi:hypothetical protein ABK040_011089 [Willaertia magna]